MYITLKKRGLSQGSCVAFIELIIFKNALCPCFFATDDFIISWSLKPSQVITEGKEIDMNFYLNNAI